MGDMREVFDTMKERKKSVRQHNLETADPTGWTVHTEFHWSRMLNGKRLDYWPSVNKWQYEGRVKRGNVNDFIKRRTK